MIAANPSLFLSYRNSGPMIPSGRGIRVLVEQPALTAEDLRIHGWINERLAAVHQEQHGFWSRVRRFLSGNRPAE
jgi:hypothetical protein